MIKITLCRQALLVVLLAITTKITYADGELDPSFQAGRIGNVASIVPVSAIVEQGDGKVLIGGSFDSLGSFVQANLGRLNSDGSPDTSFTPTINSAVRAVLLQPDNKIVIGGSFNLVDGRARNAIARLNADGSLDTDFGASIPFGVTVNTLALQANGQIIVGGNFRFVDGEDAVISRGRIARFNGDGTLDASYNPNADGTVEVITLDGDGKAIVGGFFTTVASTARNSIARINTDGTLDANFDPDANQRVDSIAVQEDGKVLFGGAFTAVGSAPTTRNSLARVNADGSLDTDFDPDVNGLVEAITIDANDNIIIGGQFSSVSGTSRNLIAMIDEDGTLDSSFNPNGGGPNKSVDVIVIDSNSKLLTGGDFTTMGGADRSSFVRLNSGGGVDGAFVPPILLSFNSLEIEDIALQDDGKILIAGEFDFVGSERREGIARLEADGGLDASFINSAVRGARVDALALQEDGTIVIVGGFDEVSGAPRSRIARLNTDGSLDVGFEATANQRVTEVAIQNDGKILIGGAFTDINGTTRNRAARLHSDGSLDLGFDPNVDSSVDAITIQTDGKILLGGSFSTLSGPNNPGGINRDRIARLNQDGGVDTTFIGVDINNRVEVITEQADGKLLIGGGFTSIAGTAMERHARLNSDGTLDATYQTDISGDVTAIFQQSDEQILIGGDFNDVDDDRRARLARLNNDGSLDAVFVDPLLNGRVNDIIFINNRSILVAGSFITVNRVARDRIARIRNIVDSSLCTAIKAQNSKVAVFCL